MSVKTLARLYYSLRCTTELETVYGKGAVHHKILVLKDKLHLINKCNSLNGFISQLSVF